MLDSDLYLVIANAVIYECKQISVGEKFTATFYTQPSILLQTCAVYVRTCLWRVSLYILFIYMRMRICILHFSFHFFPSNTKIYYY